MAEIIPFPGVYISKPSQIYTGEEGSVISLPENYNLGMTSLDAFLNHSFKKGAARFGVQIEVITDCSPIVDSSSPIVKVKLHYFSLGADLGVHPRLRFEGTDPALLKRGADEIVRHARLVALTALKRWDLEQRRAPQFLSGVYDSRGRVVESFSSKTVALNSVPGVSLLEYALR